MVGLFGANSDALGLATTTGAQIDVQFLSPSGGIGQLAGLPVMVISAPVLASASGTVVVSATSPDSSVTVASGSVTISGTLSVGKIYAGMGVAAAGTVVPVYGSGFTTATTVEIDGVVIGSTKFVSAGEVDVTLGGAAELVGKRARVTDGGVEFDYFCFQPNDPVNFPENTRFGNYAANIQPLFPMAAVTGVNTYNGYVGDVVELQNPNQNAATVNVADVEVSEFYQPETVQTLSIPSGSWAIFDGDAETEFEMTSNLPLRVVVLSVCALEATYEFCPATASPFDSMAPGAQPLQLAPPSLQFGWQMGTSVEPAAQTVAVISEGSIKTVAVTAGAAWLSVSPSSSFGSTFSVSVDPAQLAAGSYQGSIVVTQVFGPPATVPVTLTVSNAPVPTILAAAQSISFTAPAFNAAPYAQTIAITSNPGPAPFTVTAIPGGGFEEGPFAWLKVSPLSGTTPATVTVTWDPTVTAQIPYQQPSTSGSILISGPANSITIPATFNVTGVQTYQTSQGESGLGPNGLVFSAQAGTGAQTGTIEVSPAGTMTATVNQPWMTAVPVTSGQLANETVSVTVNPAGLAAGAYTGTVTIGEQGIAPIAVPVSLGVWSTPPQLTMTQGSFTIVQQVGEPPPPNQTTEIDSGGLPVPLTFAVGGSWLNLVNRFTITPAPLLLGSTANSSMLPGQYNGSFTVSSPGSSVYAPVTLLIEPGLVTPLEVSQVVNSASGIASGVSPGEILTVRGYGVGASAVSGLVLNASGAVASKLNGLQVTFDGRAAPLTYTSSNQTNLIVPYEVAGQASTVMQVTYAETAGTLQTNAWVLPVVGAAPGVFTLDSTGTGQGAIVNQDGTVNGAANAAARGSIISIYATGEGQTSPAGVTGSVTGSAKMPVLPVAVTIGGVVATVQYAGSAPGLVAGLLQVNAVVPQGISAGTAVPVVISVGGLQSQAGVTVAIR
jgi:uncharacterized protein (TIGR03437 family)